MLPPSVYQAAFDRSPVGQCLLSPSDDPLILAVNDALLEAVARDRDELVGRRVFEAFPANPEDTRDSGQAALRGSLRRVIATGNPDRLADQRYPILVPGPDGTEVFEERFWSTVSTPIFSETGELLCIAHRTEDVTERWRIEEALRDSQMRSEAALRIAQLGTFDWNLKTDAVQPSERTRQIFGWSNNEGFKAEDYFERIHPDDLPQVRAIVEASLAGHGYVEQNFSLQLPDGSIRHVKSMAISERDDKGEWDRHVGVAIDVTEHVERECALRESNRRKDEFLAMLAHELRNPLAPIAAAADLLELSGSDPETVKASSEVIARQVRHMTGLVNDLLDVARVTRGRVSLALADVEVHQPVHEAIEQVRPLMDAFGHELTLHAWHQPVRVRADPKRLVQVLTNLLTNAAKYTPAGGRITVQLEADADAVHLCVADSGEGMSPDMLKRCFDLFVQAERTFERAAGGLGIGLALVRSLVELQGGSVRAESEGRGKGSRLTITLPRLCEDEGCVPAKPSKGHAPPGEGKRARVLIVDDNQDVARMLGLLARALGYEPEVAFHPRDALERIATDPPAIYLLDIGLPEINGYELAKAIRSRLGAAPATLIALTGYGQPQDREAALRAGFDDHIVKPVDRGTLAALLASAVKNSSTSLAVAADLAAD